MSGAGGNEGVRERRLLPEEAQQRETAAPQPRLFRTRTRADRCLRI